jgi:transcriptional regulator with XRE-family HTH domain
VTFQQIQKYEKGTNRVGSSRLAKIAQILEVPVARFFDNAAGGADGPLPGPVVTDLLDVPYAVPLLEAFARISTNEIRRSLVSLAETIAAQYEN